jgi:hypothetical protein
MSHEEKNKLLKAPNHSDGKISDYSDKYDLNRT